MTALVIVAPSPAGSGALVQQRPLKNWDGSSTPGIFYKEFGAHFADSDTTGVPVGKSVAWRKGDGTTVIPSQADNVVTYASGRVKDVSVTMAYPSALVGSGSDTIKGYIANGGFNNTPWTTISALTARDIRLEVSILTPERSQQVGTGDGTTKTFSATLANAPLRPGSLQVSWNTTKLNPDTGSGGWLLPGGQITAGTINYTTGAITITFGLTPVNGTAIVVTYANTSDTGTTYTLGVNNEVTNRLATNVRQTRSGPVAVGWRIFGELRNGTAFNSTVEGDAWGYLYPTIFSDGSYSVWGTVMLGRVNKSTSKNALLVLNCKIVDHVGPVTLFDSATAGWASSAVRLYAGCPISCVDNDGLHGYSGTSVDQTVVGFPLLVGGATPDHTCNGLYDSAAIWWLASSPTERAAITLGTALNWTPNTSLDWTSINGTGQGAWIGPMTAPAARFMLSGAWSALRDDRIHALCWNACQGDWHDATVGYAANLTNTTYTGIAPKTPLAWWNFDNGVPTITLSPIGAGYSGRPVGPQLGETPALDGTHAPLYAYMQYLATGQEWWLDMLHSQVVGQRGWHNYGGNPNSTPNTSRNCTINGHVYWGTPTMTYQDRWTAGWAIRNADNSSWVTPDAHPMKPYTTELVDVIYRALADWTTPPNSPASMAALGIWFSATDNGGVAQWMHDYVMMAVAMSIRRDTITASHRFVTFHVVPWILGRFINGCPYTAPAYECGIGVGQTPGAPGSAPGFTGGYSFAQSWSDVWYGDHGALLDGPYLQPNGNPSCPVSGLVTPWGVWPTNGPGQYYGNYALVSTVCAKIAGLPGADTAYTYMQNELLAANIGEANWAVPSSVGWRFNDPSYVP